MSFTYFNLGIFITNSHVSIVVKYTFTRLYTFNMLELSYIFSS